MQYPGKNNAQHKQAQDSRPLNSGRKTTSWDKVANWYGEHLDDEDTYHAQVIAPNLKRIVDPHSGKRILDIGCGEGYFSRIFAEGGAVVVGADISKELTDNARSKSPEITFFATPADDLSFAQDRSFDTVTCVLALQNMERIEPVFQECARVLTKEGSMVFVLNHPAFRIPKQSSWGWDKNSQSQYRRVDRYLSASRYEIDMHPGKEGSRIFTYSFHRSIQDYMKALAGSGFAIVRIEEWISHRSSEKGPRSGAENRARKEIPLFMCIEARPMARFE